MASQNKSTLSEEREQVLLAIAALEEKRSLLGDQVVDVALASMREKLAGLAEEAGIIHEPQQRKLVTVLFADVSGFTAMAETMDHELVSSVINSLWSRVDKAILDHGGRIDKHIGDAVMGLFGTPTAREDDPERAIRAALQIQSEVRSWKKELAKLGTNQPSQPRNIRLRIGINTGPALLGTVGTIGEYTAIGDTVNLANRVQSAAPLDGILISHNTFQHVRGIFDVTALEPITVKGKREPIRVYTVNGLNPRSFRMTTRGLEGVETRTIGREEELTQLKAAFEQSVEQRQTALVNLVADAGLGKSRLLFEFGKWLDVQKHPVHLFKGRATQEMSQIPYALLRHILSLEFNIQDTDRAAVARQKLERGILAFIRQKKKAILYAHFIGHLIGFDFSKSSHLKGILGDSRQIRDLAFHYTTQLFAEIASDQAAVLFLEDIHWADKGSLDFFDHLMSTQPDLPLFIVGLTRATLFEQRPDWGTAEIQNLRLNLLPLSESDCHRLIAEILKKVPEIPTALTDLIIKKAEGSPFYIEELIKILIEGGVIVRGEETWTVEIDRLSDLKVPATLTGLVQARLDSLNTNVRETLQQAAVVGRIFWTNVLENMSNPETQNVASSIAIFDKMNALRAKDLIYKYDESSSSEMPEYIFKNTILHDVTYESVLLKLRPIYHLQAAQGLIEISGERVSEYAGRVGEHYERAGEWLEAAEWYARAGRQAQDTYEPDAAIDFYQKALSFLNQHGSPDQIPQRLGICSRLGEVLNWKARYTDAVEIYELMLKIAEESGNLVAQSRALRGHATSLGYLGDHRASLKSATSAETLARNANAHLDRAKALWTQGSAKFRLGDSHSASFLGEQALKIATDLDDRNEMARCLNLLGAVQYVSGDYEQAESYWTSALKIFEELGNKQQGMDLWSNLGVSADGRGDYDTAFQRYNSALEIARETGYRDGEIVFLSNRGIEQVVLKNYAAAESDLREVIRMAGTTGSWCLPNTFNYYAEALLGLGRDQEAVYAAQQGLALSIEDGTPENIGGAWRALGIVAGKTDKTVRIKDKETRQSTDYDARTSFAKSEKVYAEAEIDGERARTLREWARYELKNGDKKQGRKLWKQARDLFDKLGAQLEVDRMKELPS
ncbi:MAG TPA: adenylate/guanylate cyclase domain-containing protein [Anaerolineales bacterium]|nr:adenylate/guanylate cyclase domain-containing protein [Anaerolineales bacterium]